MRATSEQVRGRTPTIHSNSLITWPTAGLREPTRKNPWYLVGGSTWGEGHATSSEYAQPDGYQPAVFTYDRDPTTKAVTALTLTCPDRTGRPLRHSSLVRPDNEDRIRVGPAADPLLVDDPPRPHAVNVPARTTHAALASDIVSS